MDSDTLWMAFGLLLLFEGLVPFLSPQGWRRTMTQVLQLQNGQLRFFGLCSILAGLALLWFVS